MGKKLFIAEKPSVAREFAKTLGVNGNAGNGYLESNDYVVTWCVGHLVTMSYPEVYDPALKKWSLNTIPFMPDEFLYELIPDVRKQFNIVKGLLNRPDVERIYVCTDSGREGEYIYRLVDQMAEVPDTKDKRRVWIDSQTEEEILRGIREAKPLSEYDNLAASAYLRAKEDYLMGINFSRVLSLKYSQTIMNYRKGAKYAAIAVGRVMTCVLGMVVRREREIRSFVKTPFYRVIGHFSYEGKEFDGEWRSVDGSDYYQSPKLYKENGFKERTDAAILCQNLGYPKEDGDGCFLPEPPAEAGTAVVEKIERKKEKKNPPLLFNLAELQNVCSKLFKISPDETLKIVQELYEKKLVTYPRTDARVLSSAVAREISKNLRGLQQYGICSGLANEILQGESWKKIGSTRYTNDKQITDHYAIIPTGQGLGNLNGLNDIQRKVYDIIARRFLSIFFPAAEYEKVSLVLSRQIHTVVGEKENGTESFFANFKRLKNPGYLTIAGLSSDKKQEEQKLTDEELAKFASLKKGDAIPVQTFNIKEGETSPPKRYSSGTLILAMENAGQLIEDEELRSQIKGSGIGTSATRDSIITKLVTNKYIALNKKTQIVTPTFLGEIIYDVCLNSIQSLLWAEMTASWEKGLSGVAEGTISKDEYTAKMNKFVCDNTNAVKQIRNQNQITRLFDRTKPFYEKAGAKKAAKNRRYIEK